MPNRFKTNCVVLLGALVLGLLIQATLPRFFTQLDTRLGEYAWQLAPDDTPETRLVIIAIDEQSLERVGAWPWQRETLARLSRELQNAGVAQQLYDIVLPEPRPGDEQLKQQLSASSALLAQVPVLEGDTPVRTGSLSDSLPGMHCQPPIAHTRRFIGNTAAYRDIHKGHITPHIDSDGIIRRQSPLICVDGQVYPSLPIRALMLGSDSQHIELKAGTGGLEAPWYLHLAQQTFRIPLDKQGRLQLNYRPGPDSYLRISAADILEEQYDAELLRGSWALIGATAFGLGDIVPTPIKPAVPGVEIQAGIIRQLLDQTTPHTPAAQLLIHGILMLLGAGLLLLTGVLHERARAWTLPAFIVGIPVAALAIHSWLLINQQIWLGWLGYSLPLSLAAAALLLLNHARTRLEKQRIFHQLSSYLPADAARAVAFQIPNGDIRAGRKQLIVLCADIRNFSAFEEHRPPEETAALLHCFFNLAYEHIAQNHGTLYEYRGDGIIAAWPADAPHSVEQAIRCARKLYHGCQMLFDQPAPAQLEPLALGIGLEQGPVLVGSIGPDKRRVHTLLGDTLTRALRMQDMTCELSSPILVGQTLAAQLPDDALTAMGKFLLEGLRTPHGLYALTLSKPTTKGKLHHLRVLNGQSSNTHG